MRTKRRQRWTEQDDGRSPHREAATCPVLKDRCINLLAPGFEAARKRGETPVAIDATLGMGGHSEALLQRFPDLHLIGIDRDEEALALAGERLGTRSQTARTSSTPSTTKSPTSLRTWASPEVHGILMDLGVSSLQLDERERGFAYSFDAPLDMRMDTSRGQTAADVVNNYSEEELVRIIRKWGEEKFAGRIANRIVAARAGKPFATTGELVEQIRTVVPAGAAKSGGHPAKRTFQALRIEVNEELDVLERAVPAAVDATGHGRPRSWSCPTTRWRTRLSSRLPGRLQIVGAAGLPGGARRAQTRTEDPDQGHRGAHRSRNRRKPTRSLRQAPRSGTHQSQESRMSTAAVKTLPSQRRAPLPVPLPGPRTAEPARKARTPLSLVRTAPRKRRAPFVVLCFGLLAVALMAVLVLNISVSTAQYQLVQLQSGRLPR